MRNLVFVIFVFLLSQTGFGQQQPNIILINLDDADVNTLAPVEIQNRFPQIAIFALRGINFTNMHVTTSLCTPSRASLFRSQYAHNTQIRGNDGTKIRDNGFLGGHRAYVDLGHDQNDLSTWMQDAGYRTMMVGKYLTGDVADVVPPGWDDFYSSRGNKYYGAKRFTNRFSESGRFEAIDNRVNRTIAEMNDALRLIDEQRAFRPNQPFFMYLAPLNCHKPGRGTLMYEDRYESWWPSLRVPRDESFGELDMSDKRGDMRLLQELDLNYEADLDIHYRERFLSLKTWDNQLGRLIEKMNELGLNDNTYVFLTSDNGWLAGQHRLGGKGTPYDLTSRVPFFVMGPGVVASTSNDLMAHIDIAPTIVELARGNTPGFIDGQSFANRITDQFSQTIIEREPVMIENWSTTQSRGAGNIEMLSTSLRFKDRSYIEWYNGEKEFYDLNVDPSQNRNTFDQLSGAEKHFYRNKIREVKTPMTPAVGFRKPFLKNEVVGRNFMLEGVAEDNTGFWGIRIAVRDETTYKYWNGSAWQTAFASLEANVSNPTGQLTLWNTPINIPAELATESIKKVFVWAVDPEGNYEVNAPSATFQIDLTGPEVTITSPTNNTTVNSPLQFLGTVTDASQVREVRIVVLRISDRVYWNGNQLQTIRAYNNANLNEDGSWSLSAELPPGRYFVSARGFDQHGNYTVDIATQRFRVR